MALASCYNNLGLYYQQMGRLGDAQHSYHEAVALRKPIVAKYPEDPDFCSELCSSYHNLAYAYFHLGQPNNAIALYQEEIHLCEDLQRKHPQVTAHRVNLGAAYNNLGMIFFEQKNIAKASEVLQRALDLRLELAPNGFFGRFH